MDQSFRKDFGLLVEFSRAPDTNDRSLAIICTSYAEKYLGELIKSRMKGLNHDLREKLFRPGGLLGSLQARIDMGKALNILDNFSFHDLKVLASIRNLFAHNLEIAKFDHPEIAIRIEKFQIRPEALTTPEEHAEWFQKSLENWTLEERFRFVAMSICTTLHNGMNTLGYLQNYSPKDSSTPLGRDGSS